jgi:hypothetical protein
MIGWHCTTKDLTFEAKMPPGLGGFLVFRLAVLVAWPAAGLLAYYGLRAEIVFTQQNSFKS